jgi:hypothetical protein
MNVKFVEVSGHNRDRSRLEVSVYTMFTTTNQFQTTFAEGGRGVKSVSRSDCE